MASPVGQWGPAGPGVEPSGESGRLGTRGVLTLTAFYLLVAGIVLAMFHSPQREVVGLLGVGLMLVLMLVKVPVGAAMGVSGALGIFALSDGTVVLATLATLPYNSVASWSLSVVPMFILMGMLLWRAGVTEHVYNAGRAWLSWLPGGLAVGTNFAGSMLGAVSGSTVGITYAVGRVGIPEMLRAGYDRRMATGAVLMAGTGGQLLPPSILAVIFAGVATVPIGPQLLAGIVPGVVLALTYGLLILGIAVAFPRLVGGGKGTGRPHVSWSERRRTAAQVWPIPLLVLVVIGGIYGGVFTATEAGAVGAIGALLIGLVSRRRSRPASWIVPAFRDTVTAVASIFFLFIGAMIIGRMFAMTGLPTTLAAAVQEMGLGRIEFLLILMAVYLVLGMFIDTITMILLSVPILLPMLDVLDISLLWFGAFVILLGELAMITPPVGMLTFIVHRIAQDPSVRGNVKVTLGDVFQSVLWFLPATVLVLVAMIYFPEMVEFLPAAMSDR